MIFIDTNVVSALLGPDRDVVRSWLNHQARASIWLTTITVAELRYGIANMPDGKRRTDFEGFNEALIARFAEGSRVADFTMATTRHYASAMASARASGREVRSFADGAIAAIALERRGMVATRDTGPFEAMGVRVVDPWKAI